MRRTYQAHVVHLSDAAVNILTGLAEQRAKIEMLKASDFVFTTTGTTGVSGFSRAKVRLEFAMLRAGRCALGQPEDDGKLRKVLGISLNTEFPAKSP